MKLVAALFLLAAVAHADEHALIGLKRGHGVEEMGRALDAVGVTHWKKLRAIDVYKVPLAWALHARLRQDAAVAFVEPDELVAPAVIPNDPQYGNQWHLPKVECPQAWSRSKGAGITIAILDSGIDPTHPDLASKLVAGWNTVDNNVDTRDVYGHGTKVAGAAAAVTNNAEGVAGVAWASPLMPVRVSQVSGSAFLSDMAEGLTWAADHGAKVANLSFEGDIVASSQTVTNAAQYAMARGVVVVVSAGNCGCDKPNVENPYMTHVGSTDARDGLSGFSSRGAYVDLVAPGTMILTTANGGAYVAVAGTSFAAPVVSGAFAILKAWKPTAGPDELIAALEGTALDLGPAGHDNSFGAGRIRVDVALGALGVPATPTPTRTPTPFPTFGIPTPTRTPDWVCRLVGPVWKQRCK